MRLFRINRKKSNVRNSDNLNTHENDFDNGDEEQEYGNIHSMKSQQQLPEVLSIGSELDECDQFEIIVKIKNRSTSPIRKQTKSPSRRISGLFFPGGNNKSPTIDDGIDDDTTISSITSDGKRRYRLIRSSLYGVAAATSVKTQRCCFPFCFDDMNSTTKPVSLLSTAYPSTTNDERQERDKTFQARSTDLANVNSNENIMSSNSRSFDQMIMDKARTTFGRIPTKKSWTIASTHNSQPGSFPAGSTMFPQTKDRFLSSIQRRKEILEQIETKKEVTRIQQEEQEERQEQEESNQFRCIATFCNMGCGGGNIELSRDVGDDVLVQEREDMCSLNDTNMNGPIAERMRSSTGNLSNAALFDTLSEDDGDDNNNNIIGAINQHELDQYNRSEQIAIADALRKVSKNTNAINNNNGDNSKRRKFFPSNALKRATSTMPKFRGTTATRRISELLTKGHGRTATIVLDTNVSSISVSSREEQPQPYNMNSSSSNKYSNGPFVREIDMVDDKTSSGIPLVKVPPTIGRQAASYMAM